MTNNNKQLVVKFMQGNSIKSSNKFFVNKDDKQMR